MADTAVDVASLQEPGSGWSTMPCELDDGPAARAAIGLIVLANDQVIEPELNTFLPKDGVALYSSRIPLGIEGTLQALRAMEAHIAGAAGRIMPDDRLDVMAFGCTSGSMAIGDDNVAAPHPGGAAGNALYQSHHGRTRGVGKGGCESDRAAHALHGRHKRSG